MHAPAKAYVCRAIIFTAPESPAISPSAKSARIRKQASGRRDPVFSSGRFTAPAVACLFTAHPGKTRFAWQAILPQNGFAGAPVCMQAPRRWPVGVPAVSKLPKGIREIRTGVLRGQAVQPTTMTSETDPSGSTRETSSYAIASTDSSSSGESSVKYSVAILACKSAGSCDSLTSCEPRWVLPR